MKSLYCLFPILLLLTCCNDDDMSPSQEVCEEISIGTPLPIFTFSSPYHSRASYNPNNPNEFVFVNGPADNQLVFYDQQTEEKRIIYEGRTILFQPKWGKRNWILINLNDNQIWKIKPSGDSLTQLTSGVTHFYPSWNETGDAFLCSKNGLNSSAKTMIYNENGVSQDSISGFYIDIFSIWKNHDLFLYSNYNGIYCFDRVDSIPTQLVSFNTPHFGGMVLTDDDKYLVWSHIDEGVSRTNLETLETEQLIPTCNSRVYNFPTYHPETNQIIFRKLERKYLEDGRLQDSSRLVMMNTDGTDERIIEISE